MYLLLDSETRSDVNLKTEGMHRYFASDITDIVCLAYVLVDPKHGLQESEKNPVRLWLPGQPVPFEFPDAIAAGFPFVSHNAAFDSRVYDILVARYGFPKLDRSRWLCSASQAAVNGLPRALDHAARALGIAGKELGGKKAMLQVCKPMGYNPDGSIVWNEDEATHAEVHYYCQRDVEMMRALFIGTRGLSGVERRDWLNTDEMNERGVVLDREFAEAAVKLADAEKLELKHELHALTGIDSPRAFERLKDYFTANLPPEGVELMARYVNGEKKLSLDATVRDNLLDAIGDGSIAVAEEVERVLVLLNEAGASSVSKYEGMLQRCSDDGILRGSFIHAGAGRTHRTSSVGVNLQNFSRDAADDEEAEQWMNAIITGAKLESGTVGEKLKRLLRPSLCAPEGSSLIIADYSQVEARVVAWLTDDPRANELLDLFARNGKVYETMAAKIYRKRVEDIGKDSSERFVGKTTVLACGYGMGSKKFRSIAAKQGVKLTDAEAERAVYGWRDANPAITDFWRKLEDAAVRAMLRPGTVTKAGRLTLIFRPDLHLGNGVLFVVLPGNTVLAYSAPRIDYDEKHQSYVLSALRPSRKPKADETSWPREKLWGGSLVGHATQATAGALLRNAIERCAERSLPVVLQVHDELVLEVKDDEATLAKLELEALMLTKEDWHADLPLACTIEVAKRYG